MIEITHDTLDPETISAKVRRETNGAVVTFLGTTRRSTDSRQVLHLEYEAYRPMADKKLAEIVQEMRERWQVEDVAIAHRLGASGDRRHQPRRRRSLAASTRGLRGLPV